MITLVITPSPAPWSRVGGTGEMQAFFNRLALAESLLVAAMVAYLVHWTSGRSAGSRQQCCLLLHTCAPEDAEFARNLLRQVTQDNAGVSLVAPAGVNVELKNGY